MPFLRTFIVSLMACSSLLIASGPTRADDYKSTETLLETNRTIIGETIRYPGGSQAEIKAMVVVLPAGEKTDWHKHGVPLYAYILSGDLQVDYGSAGQKIYHQGDSFMEAMNVSHRGQNRGQETVRILAVFMGGGEQPLVIPQ